MQIPKVGKENCSAAMVHGPEDDIRTEQAQYSLCPKTLQLPPLPTSLPSQNSKQNFKEVLLLFYINLFIILIEYKISIHQWVWIVQKWSFDLWRTGQMANYLMSELTTPPSYLIIHSNLKGFIIKFRRGKSVKIMIRSLKRNQIFQRV